MKPDEKPSELAHAVEKGTSALAAFAEARERAAEVTRERIAHADEDLALEIQAAKNRHTATVFILKKTLREIEGPRRRSAKR